MNQKQAVLAVVAHPDDEILGLGGTLARHVDRGDRVYIFILADGVRSRQSMATRDAIEARRRMARAAAHMLGAEPPVFATFPDNRLDTVPMLSLVQAIEDVVSKVQPSVVYTHHGNDLNVDHRRAQEAVLTACRPLPNSSIRAIYAFETLSSTEWALPGSLSFRPNRFVDITKYAEAKRKAIRCYSVEMRESPHARSYEAVMAQNVLRGSTVGFAAAEAFEVLRELIAEPDAPVKASKRPTLSRRRKMRSRGQA